MRKTTAWVLGATVLAVFLMGLYLARRDRPQDVTDRIGPLAQLQESSGTASLQGHLLLRLGGQATAIGLTPEESLYVLIPEGQKVIHFDASGNVMWSRDLKHTCQCGFCVNLIAKPDGGVLLLDMRDDQICEISSAGDPVRRFPLPGSDVSVTFGILPRAVLVNSLLGNAALAAYDYDGRRLEFSAGPAWETPEQRFAYVLPVEQGWALVHRYSGLIRLLGEEGKPIAAFTKGAWDPFRSARSIAYFSCAPGAASKVWCLAPSFLSNTTLLSEIHVVTGQATNHILPGAFRSLAVSGRTVFAVTQQGNEIWEFGLP